MTLKKLFPIKRSFVIALCLTAFCISEAKTSLFSIKSGNPLILLQEYKTATFEIDYSNMMVTNGKDHGYDLNFREWMITQDEDKGKWIEDWEKKDSAECNKAFREKFNDEVKKGLKLSKLGKDYHVVLHLEMIDFGPSVKYGLGGIKGGEAKANGEIEVRDLKTNEILLVLCFNELSGESSFKQIGRLKGLFENLGEQLNEYLQDYQKQQKKLNKKK